MKKKKRSPIRLKTLFKKDSRKFIFGGALLSIAAGLVVYTTQASKSYYSVVLEMLLKGDPSFISGTGEFTAQVIPSDGLPLISYFDGTQRQLKAVKCGNSTCSSGNQISVVDETEFSGVTSSVAIGKDGLPLIAYARAGESNLWLARCLNVACSQNQKYMLDSGRVGLHSSIVIPPDGLPIIVYSEFSEFMRVRLLKCGDPTCQTNNKITILRDGYSGDLTLDSLGNPIIALYDPNPIPYPIEEIASNATSELRYIRCGDQYCTADKMRADVRLDIGGHLGYYQSIVLPADNKPFITYLFTNAASSAMKVVKCGNIDCSSGNKVSLIDIEGNAGLFESVVLGRDQLPIISYFSNFTLKVAKCLLADCSSTRKTVLDPAAGDFTSIQVGSDGIPGISYSTTGGTLRQLRYYKCSTASCALPTAVPAIIDPPL